MILWGSLGPFLLYSNVIFTQLFFATKIPLVCRTFRFVRGLVYHLTLWIQESLHVVWKKKKKTGKQSLTFGASLEDVNERSRLLF
jgi:hypothetical protein